MRFEKINQAPKKHITKSFKETQRLGEKIAKEVLQRVQDKSNNSAVVLLLQGNLGGGKTTFLQGFAKGLGIKEKVLSPTFVIIKKVKISPVAKNTRSRDFCYEHFYHFDCYRINKPEEILCLGFKKIISDPKNIVAIEWPEKIKKYIPKNSILIKFKFIDENTRCFNILEF